MQTAKAQITCASAESDQGLTESLNTVEYISL